MMKCVLIVIAIVLISSTYGGPDKDGKKHFAWMKKCDGAEMKFTDEMQKGKAACFEKYHGQRNKTAKADKDEMKDGKDNKMHHHANLTCSMMCKFQTFGVISLDGKADKAKAETFVKTVYPATVQDSLIKAYNTCIDNNPNLEMTSDGNCDSYKPFLKCIFEADVQACKWTKDATEE